MNNKMVEFRNAVIHKGLIVGKDETTLYAEYATKLLSKLIVILRTNYLTSVEELSKVRLKIIKTEGEKLAKVKGIEFKMYPIRSSLNWFYITPTPIDFDEALKMLILIDFFGVKKKEEITILKKSVPNSI